MKLQNDSLLEGGRQGKNAILTMLKLHCVIAFKRSPTGKMNAGKGKCFHSFLEVLHCSSTFRGIIPSLFPLRKLESRGMKYISWPFWLFAFSDTFCISIGLKIPCSLLSIFLECAVTLTIRMTRPYRPHYSWLRNGSFLSRPSSVTDNLFMSFHGSAFNSWFWRHSDLDF